MAKLKEVWKDVKDFEGVYKISNKGRLASNKTNKWRILSNKNSKGGYLSVILQHDGVKVYTRIHRIVYETFVGDIPKGRINQIHHKNGNKSDNSVDNLELLNSRNHRLVHIAENRKMIKGLINYNKCVKPKKIKQYDLKGTLIEIYDNAKDASLATGVCQRNILQVANREPYNDKGSIRKQAGGFIWEVVN